jgi:hypothetical protein
MNQAQWAAYKSALKTLDAGPKKIAQARAEYAEADKYMQEHKRTYSEVGQQNYYKTAQAKRDTAIKGEVGRITKALETARELRNFPDEKIDLSDAKLQAALNIVNLMGRKLPHAQQISIIQDFQGRPAELNFLADVFDSQKLYYGNYARELAKPVSEEALNNLDYCCGAYEMLGKWPFDEKCVWTKNAFAEASTRYGFNMTDTKDPYVEALKNARKGKSPEEQRIISEAIIQIQRGNEYGMDDSQKATLFNGVNDKLELLAHNTEQREIYQQAKTQQTIDAIRATAGTAENAYEGGGE